MSRLSLQALALFISVYFAGPLSAASAGTGLWGEYFHDTGFREFAAGQLDPQVNFSWPGGTPPVAGMNNSTFAVRWTGQIEALCADNYTFSTVSDDGVRLWINGNLVIDRWTTHAPVQDDAAPIFLNAGATVSVVMEFYDYYGQAQAQLLWLAPGCVATSVAIPSAQLYPAAQPIPSPTPTATALPVWTCPIGDPFSGSLGGVWNVTELNPLTPGSQSIGGSLQIRSGGAGDLQSPVFGEAPTGDSVRYVYQPVWGDFDVRMQILTVPSGTGSGQIGLMLREDLGESSRQVYAGASQLGQFEQVQRLSPGSANTGNLGGVFSAPAWVRLRRSGNVVQAYWSPTGTGWTQIGLNVNFASLSNDLLLGVAAASEQAGVVNATGGQVANFEVLSAGCTTATPTITATRTATQSSTATPTITQTPTITESFTHSPTYTDTPTVTQTPTITETFTDSPTFTHSPTVTPSPTFSRTATITPTFSVSPTHTASPTISPTFTPGPGAPLSHLVAYPNPFEERLQIGFTLGAAAGVELVVFNVAGEEVYRLTQSYSQGTHQWPWEGVNTAGTRLASGIYLLRMRADGDAGWLSEWLTVALVR